MSVLLSSRPLCPPCPLLTVLACAMCVGAEMLLWYPPVTTGDAPPARCAPRRVGVCVRGRSCACAVQGGALCVPGQGLRRDLWRLPSSRLEQRPLLPRHKCVGLPRCSADLRHAGSCRQRRTPVMAHVALWSRSPLVLGAAQRARPPARGACVPRRQRALLWPRRVLWREQRRGVLQRCACSGCGRQCVRCAACGSDIA